MHELTEHIISALVLSLSDNKKLYRRVEEVNEALNGIEHEVVKLGEAIVERDKEIEKLNEHKKLEENMRSNLIATIKSREAEAESYRMKYDEYKNSVIAQEKFNINELTKYRKKYRALRVLARKEMLARLLKIFDRQQRRKRHTKGGKHLK